MAEKESVFELDMKLDDVLGLVSEISDITKDRTKAEQDILNLLMRQYNSMDDLSKGLKDSLKDENERVRLLKKQEDMDGKADRTASERRRAEREHFKFLKKSVEWLTGYKGLKKFMPDSLPSMMIGGAATSLGLGAAGYYGYGRLADNASNLRFQSQGAYSNPAELQAAKSVYGERFFGDVGAMGQTIEGLRTNKSDPSGLVKLERLIGKIDATTSNMDILAKMPEAIQSNVAQYKKDTGDTGLALTGYGSLAPYGLDFLSPDVIRRAGEMKPDETAGLYGQYKETVKEFDPMLGDKALMNYQNTKMQMDLAGLRIENSFMDALKDLNPEIRDLTKSVSTLIKDFVQSDIAAKGIDNLKTSWRGLVYWCPLKSYRLSFHCG